MRFFREISERWLFFQISQVTKSRLAKAVKDGLERPWSDEMFTAESLLITDAILKGHIDFEEYIELSSAGQSLIPNSIIKNILK